MRHSTVLRRGLQGLLLFLVLAGGVGVGLWMHSSGPAEDRIKETIITSLQQEADTTVFITGRLSISTRLTLEETRHFPRSEELPWYTIPFFRSAGSPQVNLGTNRTALRVPGRVSYGFSLEQLTTEDITIVDRQSIRISIPKLDVYSTEPQLEQLDVQTELGWARWSSSGRQLERRALGDIREAMRRQGQQHLQQSEQPTINTMRALRKLLGPVLQSAGIENPRFEFHTPLMQLTLPPERGSSTLEHQ